MNYKFKCLITAAASLVTSDSFADSPIYVKQIVETELAVFWEPAGEENHNIIFYFPKTETSLVETGRNSDRVRGYRATLKSKITTLPALESVNPQWSGKSLRPFSIRSTESCRFNGDDILFLKAELDSAGRTVSGSEESICQFSFSIRMRNLNEVSAQLNEKAKANTLIGRRLPLSLAAVDPESTWELPWSDLYRQMIPYAGQKFEHDEAVLLLGLTLAHESSAAGKVRSLQSEDRLRFVEYGLNTLFSRGSDGRLLLSSFVPEGMFISNKSEVRNVEFQF